MKSPLAVFTALTLAAASYAADSSIIPAEQLQAVHLLVTGEPASAEELQAGALGPLEVPAAKWRRELQTDRSRKSRTVQQAYRDALGREASADELAHWRGIDCSYSELVTELVRGLTVEGRDYQALMERAYRRALDRSIYPGEVKYWQSRSAVSFILMVSCIEDWARRNQPGLMETAGVPAVSVNSRHLRTVRLSPAAAQEVRSATGLSPVQPALAVAAGRNVIAPAGESVVSVGGIHFVAIGR